MSITVTVSKVDRRYLRNKTKEEIIDILFLYQDRCVELENKIAELTEAQPVSHVDIDSPEFANHPISKANAASWPTGPKRRKK